MKIFILVIFGLFLVSLSALAQEEPQSNSYEKKEPRITHIDVDESNVRFKNDIRIGKTPEINGNTIALLGGKIYSPNRVYWFVQQVYLAKGHRYDINVRINNGSETMDFIHIRDIYYPNFVPELKWINEKLLFIRVWWGRLIGADLIFDVEKGEFIYKESIHFGNPSAGENQQGIKSEQ